MDELVRGFAEGQISRRVFIRRLVTAGVAMSGAVAFADLIQADPAAAMEYHYVDVADYAFSPVKATLSGPGDYVVWDWSGGPHSITVDATDGGLFDSSPIASGGSVYPSWNWVTAFGWEMWAAGTFPYLCKDQYHTIDLAAPMNGKVRVPVRLSARSGRTGKDISVEFGSRSLDIDSKFRYEVQLRKPGRSWRDWVTDGMTPSRNYRARTVGKHQFRARLRNNGVGSTSGWSPVATFTAK